MDVTTRNKIEVYSKIIGVFIYSSIVFVIGGLLHNSLKTYKQSIECQKEYLSTVLYATTAVDFFIGLFLIIIACVMLFNAIKWQNGMYENTNDFGTLIKKFTKLVMMILVSIQSFNVVLCIFYIQIGVYNTICPTQIHHYGFVNIFVIFNIPINTGIVVIIGYTVEKILNILLIIYLAIRYCGNLEIIRTKFETIVSKYMIFSNININVNVNINANNLPSNSSTTNVQIITDNVVIEMPQLVETKLTLHDTCPICLEVMEFGCKLKNCEHWVCKECWPKTTELFDTCPLCRTSIV